MNTALNRTTVALLTNKSGGSVAQGDVVIVDSANASAFTTTTTSSYASGSIGVVLEPNGIASNAIGTVAFGGYVPVVNLSSSASLGDLFHTHSVAKQALRHAAPIVGGDFGQVLATGATPAAFLWGQPAAAAGAGSTTFAGDTDVSLASLANLDQIQYQTGDSKFHNVKGGMVRLGQSSPSGVNSVTFSSISGSYSDLIIRLQGRSSLSGASDTLWIQFNSDTGSNYDWSQITGTGSTVSAAEFVATTHIPVSSLPGATADANRAGLGVIDIPNYAGTTFYKNVQSTDSAIDNVGSFSGGNGVRGGQWRNTGAITSITLALGSGNFVAGSLATLWALV